MLKILGGIPLPKSEVIATPSFGLNHVLGGGFWTGRFSLLWGNPSSGKTTFLLHTLAQAQEQGYTPVIIDAEGSYTDEWAANCGMDMDNRIYIKSNVWEQIRKEVVPLMKSQDRYVFLFDSINAIASEAFYEDKGGMASGARTRNSIFQGLGEYLHPANNAVFMVSQQTMDLSGTYPRMAAKIGNAEHHWCTNIVRLFGSSAKDNLERSANDLIINKQVKWTIEKSKQAPIEGTTGSYWFSPQSATIDRKKEMINIAVENNVIMKSGAWFIYGDDKYHGFEKLAEGIKPYQLDQIMEKLNAIDLVFGTDEDE